MKRIQRLENIHDENDNIIQFDGTLGNDVDIIFKGSNNKLVVSKECKSIKLSIEFDCNNALCVIGKCSGEYRIRIGEDSVVSIGNNATTTTRCFISAAEGAKIEIGDDCMIASGVSIRTHDSHPIFDVASGKRINKSANVLIGRHVWLGQEVAVLGGAKIGDGSVVGIRSVVKKKYPNNCILAGVPARVTRTNIAWERPHLTLAKPYYKNHIDDIKKGDFWHYTAVE